MTMTAISRLLIIQQWYVVLPSYIGIGVLWTAASWYCAAFVLRKHISNSECSIAIRVTKYYCSIGRGRSAVQRRAGLLFHSWMSGNRSVLPYLTRIIIIITSISGININRNMREYIGEIGRENMARATSKTTLEVQRSVSNWTIQKYQRTRTDRVMESTWCWMFYSYC